MSLLKKKCAYCGNKIDRGREVFRDVKIIGFVGTKRKPFISKEHADSYEKEIEEYLKNQKKCGGSCCG
ncbi:hypothetical protein COU59_03415 [Candidatus Pacearchaeota archaeon CG10_big_fil_rev_8_21_14_0_10_34_12]|nr:MAG: hypothetical protein COU59_03415 [Candidatus Pacearchaeota archaeon CG10_big_fil_rev_8_21_14_0_10_34_12]